MSNVELSALIVSWNTRELLRECLLSTLGAASGLSFEVIVVDNASGDESAAMVRRVFAAEPRVRLIANARNENFARGNNQAYAASRGSHLLIMNPDVVLNSTALRGMIEHLEAHPGVGIVSCSLVGTDGRPQTLHRAFPTLPIVCAVWTRAGRILDRWLLLGLNGRRYRLQSRQRSGLQVVDQAAAACLLIRRTTVEAIGGLFDERFPLFFNDVDLSRRVREAGFQVHVRYDLSVLHHGRGSIRQLPEGERRLELYEALTRYYDLHHTGWRARVVRLMISGNRRQATRIAEAARVRTPVPR